MTFVPIIEEPFKNQDGQQLIMYAGDDGLVKKNQFYIRRNYIKGTYVARIVVRPQEIDQIYFWKNK